MQAFQGMAEGIDVLSELSEGCLPKGRIVNVAIRGFQAEAAPALGDTKPASGPDDDPFALAQTHILFYNKKNIWV